MFTSEKELSEAFEYLLKQTEWADSQYFSEVDGISGIPDYVLIKNDSISIGVELKLENWKRAMIQAFRYRAFCNLSYVIMDDEYINRALRKIEEFKKYNIGLASINKHKMSFSFHYRPKSEEPFSELLSTRLQKKLLTMTS
jgi:hypothetical protein